MEAGLNLALAGIEVQQTQGSQDVTGDENKYIVDETGQS